MASEKRLIAFDDIFPNHCFYVNEKEPMKSLDELIARINNAPAVDAVEVVRCKDCKHGMKSHLQPRHVKNYLCRHSWEGEYHEADHFCSYGERKADVHQQKET